MPTFVTGQVELDHLVKVLSASFLLGRGSIILFIISTCLLGSYFEVVQVSHFSSYFCPEFLVSFNDPANEDYYAFAGLRMISSSITPSRLIEKFFLSSYLFIHSLTLFFFFSFVSVWAAWYLFCSVFFTHHHHYLFCCSLESSQLLLHLFMSLRWSVVFNYLI